MFDKNQVRLILQYKIQTSFTFHPSGKKSWIKINPDYDRKVKNELKIELLSPLFIEQNKNPLKERCFKTQPSLRGKKIKMCKILTGKRCWLISTTKVCPTRCVRFSRSQLWWFLKLTKPKKINLTREEDGGHWHDNIRGSPEPQSIISENVLRRGEKRRTGAVGWLPCGLYHYGAAVLLAMAKFCWSTTRELRSCEEKKSKMTQLLQGSFQFWWKCLTTY